MILALLINKFPNIPFILLFNNYFIWLLYNMVNLCKTFLIVGEIIAIIAAVLCIVALFTKNKPNSSRFGLTIDQVFSASTSLFLFAFFMLYGFQCAWTTFFPQ